MEEGYGWPEENTVILLTFIYNEMTNHNLTTVMLWKWVSEAEISTRTSAHMETRRASSFLLEHCLYCFFIPFQT